MNGVCPKCSQGVMSPFLDEYQLQLVSEKKVILKGELVSVGPLNVKVYVCNNEDCRYAELYYIAP